MAIGGSATVTKKTAPREYTNPGTVSLRGPVVAPIGQGTGGSGLVAPSTLIATSIAGPLAATVAKASEGIVKEVKGFVPRAAFYGTGFVLVLIGLGFLVWSQKETIARVGGAAIRGAATGGV